MAGRWVVECPSYTLGPFPTRETAERHLVEVERLGACHDDHVVREA